jgi:hypothetical protein
MKKILWLLVALPGVLFLTMGLRWLVAPEGAAAELGMPLLDGVGRSAQIGDKGAFFLALGLFIICALTTAKRVWYYPAIALLGLAALSRTVAWLFHGAPLVVDAIVPEVLISLLLLFASTRLAEQD